MPKPTSVFAAALAVAALSLGACDRYEDSTLAPPVAAPPVAAPPAAAQDEIYIKGSPSVKVGVRYEFRAQAVEGVVLYVWSSVGTGGTVVNTNGNARTISLTGTRPGAAVVRVTAYDASERVLATGRRDITIVE
ncbi:MAG TPA: hypothetical protein VGB53_16340 [Rubricoccaceae bacterium]|jgi:hypothetical protein